MTKVITKSTVSSLILMYNTQNEWVKLGTIASEYCCYVIEGRRSRDSDYNKPQHIGFHPTVRKRI